MPIRHAGNCAVNVASWPRGTRGLASIALPVSSTPSMGNTFLARSIPIVTIAVEFPLRWC